MSTINNALLLRRQPSPHSSFKNFKKWIKGAILRNQKEKQPMLTAQAAQVAQATIERSLKRIPSVKRVPSKRSSVRRKSQRLSHQPSPHRSRKLFNLNSVSNLNSSSSSNSNKKNNDNNRKSIIIDNNNNDDDNSSDNNCSDNECWVDEEIAKKDELIIQNIFTSSLGSTDTTTVISNTPSDQDLQRSQSFSDTSSDISRDDFLEDTRIIKGSVEHFAYVRTLRKLRGKRRTMNQVLLLNNILEYLSYSQLSNDIREALNSYKTRVYELNRIKRNSININYDTSPYSTSTSFNDSTSSICPSSMVNKRLSAILTERRPTTPVTVKYRASYASTKVMTVFDEESDKLIVKDLPMARRRRRLSDLSVLGRSTTSSSTSTNSSQSSLVTLTDDVEQNRFSPITTKEPDSYLSNLVVIQDNDDNDDEDDEDNVPLFVLKEQFRYSGRSYTYLKNNAASVEENGPSRVTLTV